jgi:hypothetical protein
LEAVTMATHPNSISEQKRLAGSRGDPVDLYRTLSITDERIAIGLAFLGFVQQIACLLWKFLHAGIPIH